MTEETWRIRYTPRARRDLRRLDRQVARRVVMGVDRLGADDSGGDIRKLRGSGDYRLRIGDCRIRFTRDRARREIIILRVLPRGRAYDR